MNCHELNHITTLVICGFPHNGDFGLLLAATVLEVVGIKGDQAVLIIAFIFPCDRLLDMM